MQVEQDTERVHQNHAHYPVAQMPQITRPDPCDSAAIGQLSKDRIDAVAHPAQYSTPTVSGLSASFAKGSLKDHSDFAQICLQIGQPVVAVAQEQAGARYIWVMTPGQHSRICSR